MIGSSKVVLFLLRDRILLNVTSFGKQKFGLRLAYSTSDVLSRQAVTLANITSEPTFPQGIQGDNDANLKLWFDTCNRYGLENCHDQLQGIQSGRKTLSQVLAEQDALIQQIAEQYKAEAKKQQYETDSIQGVQDINHLPNIDTPCPQGVQGSECAQFKLWLQNCHRFGFQNCLEQFQSARTGQKTLSDIFKEQDHIIRSVVSQYQQKRSYSTSPKSSDPNRSATSTANTTEPEMSDVKVVKLSQKERFKKAVKEYGATVIVFHVGISLISLGGFYLAVSSGIDLVGILTRLGVGESILQSKVVSGAGTFVVAYAVHKVFAPVRIGITLTSSPFIVRYLRRIGFLKTPKTIVK
ncbi:uncharacterized protein LOC126815179 [Patella vulgata]|uniref:uncharacterized protein LOC126815179 n=1 Tax=Patella vulgata TaxID=6465 RepID=UPI00217F604A|nr:uncharacterized protein LOC126815179 [Patella vulgata]